MSEVQVLAVVSEVFPLVKTGGLADVAGSLPQALRREGVHVVTLVPGYPAVKTAIAQAQETLAVDELFGGPARVLIARVAGLDLLVLDAPHLFDRAGSPYTGADGTDWSDNALRFGALGWIGARIGLGDVAGFVPDILHGHDWQAGLSMAYLAYVGGRRPATVMTIHNLAYQGQFSADFLSQLKLPPRAMAIDGVEHYGAIGFLKAGLQFADRITTVSPTYAKEIQTDSFGFGFEGLLRQRADVLSGIRNGIDIETWNPQTDGRIKAQFSLSSPALRSANKAEIQRRFGLQLDPDRLLFGVISRIVWQKGLDLLADALPALVGTGAQLAVLGTGDPELERRLAGLATTHAGRVGCVIGYDEDLAHLIQAGADALLIPSRFEPCGLTQLCAMRYGAVPVASRVGGLADTITDPSDPAVTAGEATGLLFHPVDQAGLEGVLRRTANFWSDRAQWHSLQAKGMTADVSWTGPAKEYASLYSDLLMNKL